MHNVTFLPSERKISVDEEENLLQAAMEAGIHINASCGGSATCGKCKVRILMGIRSRIPPRLPDSDSG
jgi:uncharacterized 2Fe-2S/4Fe-4S cluster protein (DUF4445 family)